MFWALRPKEYVRDKYIMKGKSMVKAIYAVNMGIYPDFYGKRYYFTLFCLFGLFPFEYSLYYCLYIYSIVSCIQYDSKEFIGITIACAAGVYLYGAVVIFCTSRKDYWDKVMEMVGRGFCRYSRPYTKQEQRYLDSAKKVTGRYAVISTIVLFNLSLIHFWILPIVKLIQSGVWSTVTNGSIPINDNDPFPVISIFGSDTKWSYLLTYFHEAFAATYQYLISNGYAIIYVGLCEQLTAHLRMLTYSLADMHARGLYLYTQWGKDPAEVKGDVYSDEFFQRCMNVCLRENVRHHIKLIKFYHAIQNIVGFGILAIFTGVAVIISTAAYTSIYVLSKEDSGNAHDLLTLAVWVMNTVGYMTLMIVYCTFGQRVLDHSNQLLHSFYNTPWIYCNTPFRKTLTISMSLCQTEMTFTGMGLVPANRVSIVDIIKTSYSYLNILLASNGG